MAWNSAFWNCNAVLLYNYCVGADEVGNVWTGSDRTVSSFSKYICGKTVKNTCKRNFSIEKA